MPLPPFHPSAGKVDHPGWAMLVSLVWIGFFAGFFFALRKRQLDDGADPGPEQRARWTRPMVVCFLGAMASYAVLLAL